MAFKEWKEYRDFFFSEIDRQNKAVKESVPEIVSNLTDTEKILEFFYDTRLYPMMYETDFNLLSFKLVTIYQTLKDDIKVDDEAQKEIDNLLKGYKSSQKFVVRSGKAEPINPELIEAAKKQFKNSVEDKKILEEFEKIMEKNGQ